MLHYIKSPTGLRALALTSLFAGVVGSASAQYLTDTNLFPTSDAVYGITSPELFKDNSVATAFTMSFTPHAGFDYLTPPINGDSVDAFFDLTLNMTITPNGGSQTTISATGLVDFQVTDLSDVGTTHQYSIAMTSFSLDPISGPILLRENPGKVIGGSHTIEDLGSSSYQITSYFDVFAEISYDNGSSWIVDPTSAGGSSVRLTASRGSSRTAAPEPITVCLMMAGATLGFGRIRKGKSKAKAS